MEHSSKFGTKWSKKSQGSFTIFESAFYTNPEFTKHPTYLWKEGATNADASGGNVTKALTMKTSGRRVMASLKLLCKERSTRNIQKISH